MADLEPIPIPPGVVEAFYFSDSSLYGCLHPGPDATRGAVVCQPVGHEYITFHRAAKQIAAQVSRAGLPTLRFDYSGTGDSSGRLRDARLAGWISDVGRAVDELKERTGVQKVSLVGVRLGASLALMAAEERTDVEALALWDPVIRGRSWLGELKRDHRRMQRLAHVTAREPGASGDRGLAEGDIERLGFVFPGRMVDDLRGLELDTLEPSCRERFLLLETTAAASAPLGALLRGAGCQVETRTEALAHAWRWSEDITRVQLPHAQVRAVARWVTEGGG